MRSMTKACGGRQPAAEQTARAAERRRSQRNAARSDSPVVPGPGYCFLFLRVTSLPTSLNDTSSK
jgi:hypothetical protein